MKALHEPHQKVIKTSYLNQMQFKPDPPLQFVNNFSEVKKELVWFLSPYIKLTVLFVTERVSLSYNIQNNMIK